MSEAVTFKCPSCGAYLEFDPAHQAFNCPFCGGSYDEKQLIALSQQKEAEQQTVPKAEAQTSGGLRTYQCHTCGAEIVTEETTAATRCYYCHHPVVLSDRLADEFRPDSVIPFTITREQAEQQFEQYLAGKKYVDRRFFNREQRENITGVYYPYWYCDVEGSASFDGEGQEINRTTTSSEIVTVTRYYDVHRKGRVNIRNLFRKALSKNDRQLTDGIHPYQAVRMKPFAMGYLSGFMAEKRDVPGDAAQADMLNEAHRLACDSIRGKGKHFDRLKGKSDFSPDKVNLRYCLLPTWVLTYRGDKPGTTFYFMMNGQTGKTCGRLPVDQGKLLGTAAGIFAAVCAILCLGGRFIW